MKNPWGKKNPFMSMWLSGANAVAGAAPGRAPPAGQRPATTPVRNTAPPMTEARAPPVTRKPAPKRRRRKSAR